MYKEQKFILKILPKKYSLKKSRVALAVFAYYIVKMNPLGKRHTEIKKMFHDKKNLLYHVFLPKPTKVNTSINYQVVKMQTYFPILQAQLIISSKPNSIGFGFLKK